MRTPTTEQLAVLTNPSRVRVVRAAPGSGKTWLVAELIRQELSDWPIRTSGIAALSFTRVGGDEIRKAVGYELGHPHFVGTIDSFLFRYVIRPFFQKCFTMFASPRLIPAEWEAEHWGHYSRNDKAIVGTGINLFGCVFIDEENGNVVVAHKPHPAQPLITLCDPDVTIVKDAKKQMWTRSGRLTHSDAALCASKILDNVRFGTKVRAELVRRFPLIIVDELQDTGYFLGKSIRLLLNEPDARGVLVGDPDQSIYEFNGARPDLFCSFETIKDAVTLPLSKSRRCSSAVVNVAAQLKDSAGRIESAHTKTGRTFLLQYGDMSADVSLIIDAVTTMQTDNATIKVIARHSSTVDALIGRSTKPAPKLGCSPLNHMQRAIVAFLQGRQVAALASSLAALELVVFHHEGVEAPEFEEYGIDPSQWKRLAVECLLHAAASRPTGTLYDWQTDVGNIIDDKLCSFGLGPTLQFTPGRLKPQKRKGWDQACGDHLPQPGASVKLNVDVPIMTVHSAKGETHDVTIFVCSDPKKPNYCPSAIWWSEDEKAREEKRIAYVAMTRSRGDLIVCVSPSSYQRLCTTRKDFVDGFDCMSVDDFIFKMKRERAS